jgi:hypothetical protein
VKSQQKTTSVEEKLGVISQLERGIQIVDIGHNVRLSHSCVHAVHVDATRFKLAVRN